MKLRGKEDEDEQAHLAGIAGAGEPTERGLPDNVIQELQGWADVSLVGVYRDTSTEDTIGMYFDENGIKPKDRTELKDL